ncbi:hypothetical protein [Sphingobium yanoikuyae]
MPRYNLAAMARRQRNVRRSSVTIRDIEPPATFATDLYRSCYMPVVNAWANALPRINAAYERSLSELTQDSPADVRAEIDGAAEAINRLILILTPQVRDWALRVEKFVRTRWRGAILSAVGVDLDVVMGPEDARETLETVLERNVALIRDVSAQAQGRISDAVFRGLSERRPARDVAKDIRAVVDMGRDRSIRIASHQLSALSSDLARERRRDAGLEVFAWHHSRKLHPRTEHQRRDGNLYTENPALVGKKVDGRTVLAAPQASDRAGIPPYCGCRERAVLVFAFDGED